MHKLIMLQARRRLSNFAIATHQSEKHSIQPIGELRQVCLLNDRLPT